jgi:hypothetical protein
VLLGSDGNLNFVVGHLVAAFAVTKELAREINKTLGDTIRQDSWALLAVDDYYAQNSKRAQNDRQWFKGLVGYARFHYSSLKQNLTPSELREAAISRAYLNEDFDCNGY